MWCWSGTTKQSHETVTSSGDLTCRLSAVAAALSGSLCRWFLLLRSCVWGCDWIKRGHVHLRVSSYVIGAPLTGQPFGILLHGLTGAVDKVPRGLAVALASHVGAGADEVAGELQGLSSDDVDRLVARGYLTALSAGDERRQMLHATAQLHESDLATSEASMVMVPTYLCSLRCAYCFQSHQLHAGKGQWGRVMSIEQADHAFAVVDDFCAPGAVARHLGLVQSPASSNAAGPAALRSVGLFGGEPLGAPTVEVVGHIVRRAVERGTNVWSITNGVELDLFESLLGPDRIAFVQITFDGMADLHDSRRTGPRFRQTFERISQNVDLALECGVRVSARMNVDSTNFGEVEPLSDYFTRRGWSDHPNFDANAAVVTGQSKAHNEPVTHAQLVSLTQDLARAGARIDSYELRARDTLLACLSGVDYPFRRVANCSAETGQLMFDPMGHVYACWEDIGKPNLRIGSYGKDGIAFDTQMATQWLTRYPGGIEQCSSCPYALIHRSGCAAHARDRTDSLLASACESFQTYFPDTLARAYESFESELLAPSHQTDSPEVVS